MDLYLKFGSMILSAIIASTFVAVIRTTITVPIIACARVILMFTVPNNHLQLSYLSQLHAHKHTYKNEFFTFVVEEPWPWQ